MVSLPGIFVAYFYVVAAGQNTTNGTSNNTNATTVEVGSYYNESNTRFPVNLHDIPASLGPYCYSLDAREQKDLGCGSVMTLSGVPGSNRFGSADGGPRESSFNELFGIDISPDGQYALVADAFNHKIRHIDIATGRTKTLVGSGKAGNADGSGTAATLSRPSDVSISPDGTFALVSDLFNHQIRRVELDTTKYFEPQVSTICGSTTQGDADGVGDTAALNRPFGVEVGGNGLYALFSDQKNNKIRRIDLATNKVSTFCGSGKQGSADGKGADASFNSPRGIAVAPDETFAFVADTYNNMIRRLEFIDRDGIIFGEVTTLAGSTTDGRQDGSGWDDGRNPPARFFAPYGVDISASGQFAMVADTSNNNMRTISLNKKQGKETRLVTTHSGDPAGRPGGVDVPEQGAFVAEGEPPIPIASYTNPTDVAISPDGHFALVADGANVVRVLSMHGNTYLAVNSAVGANSNLAAVSPMTRVVALVLVLLSSSMSMMLST